MRQIRNLLLCSIIIFTASRVMAVESAKQTTAGKPLVTKKEEQIKQPSQEDLFKISSNDQVVGDKGAKVTVIEYASMTCPHCADFHKNTYPDIKTKYIDTGKVKFVFRSFPLDEPALRASMLAYCSGNDKFFKFIDMVFSTQNTWALSKNYKEILSNIGKLGGMSGEDFDKCMANSDLEKRIMQDKFNATTILNVRSTPSLFVNGVIYKGTHNFEYFSKVLDEAISTSSEKTKK